MNELDSNCLRDMHDMTNASSTYLGIVVGAVIGVVITWWVYNRQKKTSEKQDETLKHLKDLDETHETILKSIEEFQKHQEKLLNQIFSLDKKIDTIVEKRNR